jgi:hypothetical protein
MPSMDHLNEAFFPVINAHLQDKDLEYRHNKGLPPHPLSAMPTILFVSV